MQSGSKNRQISVVMTSYNYESYISDAIESVINQSYDNWELIIVDDGSADNSVEIIKKYCSQDERIKLYQHEDEMNKGLKESLLLGINKASNEWIAFLESDDLYEHNHIQEKIRAIKKYPNAGFIFNDVEIIGDKTEIEGCNEYLSKRGKILSNNEIKYKDLMVVNLVPSFSCAMTKKEILLLCDFNSPIPASLDYFLWIQMYNKTKIAHIPKKLTKWRKHSQNYTKTASFLNVNKFESKLLHILSNKKRIGILNYIYERVKTPKIEKLLRPQINFICDVITRVLLKNHSCKILKIRG